MVRGGGGGGAGSDQYVSVRVLSAHLVCKQNIEARLITIVSQGGLNHLVGRGDPRTTANQAHVRGFYLFIGDLEVPEAPVLNMAEGPLHLDPITDLDSVEVLAHEAAVGKARVLAREVDFDDQVEVAQLFGSEGGEGGRGVEGEG